MFKSNTDALLREIEEVGKRLKLANERIAEVETERDHKQRQLEQVEQQLEAAADEIAVLKSENAELVSALDSQVKLTDAEMQIRSDKVTKAVIQELLLAAEHQPMSIELERACHSAQLWLEKNQ
jgi:chromosome segregation ATPase